MNATTLKELKLSDAKECSETFQLLNRGEMIVKGWNISAVTLKEAESSLGQNVVHGRKAGKNWEAGCVCHWLWQFLMLQRMYGGIVCARAPLPNPLVYTWGIRKHAVSSFFCFVSVLHEQHSAKLELENVGSSLIRVLLSLGRESLIHWLYLGTLCRCCFKKRIICRHLRLNLKLSRKHLPATWLLLGDC